ncbi:hypothetical protein LSH36_535g00011 [Paralvinella palmiformis]|uniref:Uncharacterized protein n=1 Tax=Paralvinella palmiformis TaxID=53620 RepID=A0AAD9J8Q3_9ANNE|nr:hypothetical protein LSH36_535g00011 [Paralvinella palmiformis]
MATGGIFEEISDMTSCEICLEPLEHRRPRTLSCLHVFCEDCLQHLLDDAKAKYPQNPGTIPCPVCSQKTQVPGGSSANLPLFFYLSRVHNIRKELEERHKLCKICRSKTHKANISFYCFGCGYGHCQNCHVKHDAFYPDHTQISVTLSTINYIFCDEHDGHLSYFCMTCTKAICSQCRMGTHSEHIVYDLTYDNKKTQVDLKEILVSYLQSTDKTLENFVNLETKVINDLKQAMTEMTHHRDDLIKQINDQYDSLCLELQQKEAGIKLELSRSKQLVLDVRTSIENLITKVDSWLEPVMGIPEGRIEDTAKLITDVKKQIPSFDINIKTETVKFMIGDDQIKLGEIIEEELKCPIVAGSMSPLEDLLTEVVQNLDTMSVIKDPTLLREIETSKKIRDIEYLDNGQLIVCMRMV